ncbi:DUF423 domain-containing protein [Martelella soudanensis]|uniref:DUF423 domain-containing protein n=1 Tax=unclassified Martelella TaxID=2629616 RepID=UPI0015DE286E|nr:MULTISPECIES: DUF423 domain-containing protein [unclassified Martelella]
MAGLALSSRILLFCGGLTGASGVMLAAAAYHGDSAVLQSAALVCLANGPALLALAMLAMRTAVATASGILIAFGTLLFAGDIAALAYMGSDLFRMAAPVGGTAIIAGWLMAALAALLPASRD